MSGQRTLDETLSQGDVTLRFPDGRSVKAHRAFLVLASHVMRQFLPEASKEHDEPSLKRHASQAAMDASSSTVTVDGCLEDWMEVLRLLYNGVISEEAATLTPATAFRILPIAHQYNMPALLKRCDGAFDAAKPQFWNSPLAPSPSLASAASSASSPDLFEWLALSDSLQYTPMIRACLSQLSEATQPAVSPILGALYSPVQRGLLQGLRQETCLEVINMMSGLPYGFKGSSCVPRISQPPSVSSPLVTNVDGPLEDWAGTNDGLISCLWNSELVFDVHHQGQVSLQIWDLDKQMMADRIPIGDGDQDTVISINVSANGLALVLNVEGLRTRVNIWDLTTRQRKSAFEPPDIGNIYNVGWHGNHCVVYKLFADSVLKIWDISTGLEAMPSLKGHDERINSWQSWEESSLIISGSKDKTIRLWDTRTGKCVRTMEGHQDAVYSVRMDFSGRTAVSSSSDGTVRVWDLGTGLCIGSAFEGLSIADGDTKVALDPSGTTVLASFSWSRLRSWDLTRQVALDDYEVKEGHHMRTWCHNPDLTTLCLITAAPVENGAFLSNIQGWR